MKVGITNIEDTKVKGIRTYFPEKSVSGQERYFKWEESSLLAKFNTGEVSGGILSAWHHALEFQQVEFHKDEEMFYFLSGSAIMLFIDIYEGKVKMETAQVVRIPMGTQIVIEKGKGHFVAIAEGDEPVKMVVVSPKISAPRVNLEETIYAVQGVIG